MDILIQVFLLTTLGSLAGLIGGIFLISNKNLTKSLSLHAIPFAAGVMLAVAFLDLLHESVEQFGIENASIYILGTIVGAFFFEHFFLHLHHHGERPTTLKSTTKLVVVGDSIHNFIDGVVIAAAFLVQPELGFVVALATFLHEVPHEIGDFGVMLAAGWKGSKVITVNLLSAMFTYLGAISVFLFSEAFAQNLGIPLSVATGLFIYIGASDLLPEVHNNYKDNPWHQALLLLLGVGLIVMVSQLLPH